MSKFRKYTVEICLNEEERCGEPEVTKSPEPTITTTSIGLGGTFTIPLSVARTVYVARNQTRFKSTEKIAGVHPNLTKYSPRACDVTVRESVWSIKERILFAEKKAAKTVDPVNSYTIGEDDLDLTVIVADDWQAIYINGRLSEQNHTIDWR